MNGGKKEERTDYLFVIVICLMFAYITLGWKNIGMALIFKNLLYTTTHGSILGTDLCFFNPSFDP